MFSKTVFKMPQINFKKVFPGLSQLETSYEQDLKKREAERLS